MRGTRPHRVLVDLVLGLLLGAAGWATAVFSFEQPDLYRRGPYRGPPLDRPEWQAPPTVLPMATVGALLLLVVAGVALRRVWPRVSFVVVVVGLGGYLAVGGPVNPVLLALPATVFALAGAFPLRRWLPLTVLLVPLAFAGHWREPYAGLLNPGLYAGGLGLAALAVLPVTFALLRRVRRENDLREREADRRRYIDEERLRIAREVHDLVGHSLSVITMQAGVALHVLEKQPDQVATSLEAIRTTSIGALDELRTTLAVFREADGSAPHGPRPGLDRLDALVAALVSAGRRVHLERDGVDPTRLPAAVDQAAFRIVQEALTNVVRHAGSAAADVRIEQRPDRLRIVVTDDGPTRTPPVPGDGLQGMAERAAAVGGTLDVRVGDPSGVSVTADLPLAAAER